MTKTQVALIVLEFMETYPSNKNALEFCANTFTGEAYDHAVNCVKTTQTFVKESRQEYRDIKNKRRGAGLA